VSASQPLTERQMAAIERVLAAEESEALQAIERRYATPATHARLRVVERIRAAVAEATS
jgi:hypothetical protein